MEETTTAPLPFVEFAPGDGDRYTVGLIPILHRHEPRTLFVFGKGSGSLAKVAFILDQHPRTINWDTFAKLFQSDGQSISVRASRGG